MPNYHRKRVAGPLLLTLSAVTAGIFVVGCSSDSGSSASGDIPGSDHTSSSSTSNTNNAGVAYAKCMREHGVSNFPDPDQASSGGMKVVVPKSVDQTSTTFKSAQAACQNLLYQGNAGNAAGTRPFDATKVAAWAKCLRQNGLPNFPDPQVNGDAIIIDANAAGVTGRDDPKFAKAAAACYSIRPGGMLAFSMGPQQ